MNTNPDKILVVEDERLVAEDISECLRSVGYDVIGTAKSSEEAVAKVDEGRPDLVMMDITLRGDVDGIETAAILKERFSTPVVFLTAYSQKAILDRAKMVEPLGYVVKPFDESSLVSTVEMALHKARVDHALRKSEEWFSTTLRSIGDGVIATDERGKVRFLNRVAENLTGWGAKEAEGQYIGDVFHVRSLNDDSELPIPAIEAMESGQVVELAKNAVLIRRDGSRIDVNDSGAPIYDNEGNLAGSVLVFRDVTETNRHEEEMDRYREQLETMVEERTAKLNWQIEMESLMNSITGDLLRVTSENWREGFNAALRRFGEAAKLDAIAVWRTDFDEQKTSAEIRREAGWARSGHEHSDEEVSRMPVVEMSWLREKTDAEGAVAVASVSEVPEHAVAERMVMEAESISAFVNLSIEIANTGDDVRISLFSHVCETREWGEDIMVFFRMLASAYKNTVERVEMEEQRIALTSQLNQSQKLEAVGKLTGGIAHDFNNILVPIIGYADEILADGAKGDYHEEVSEIRRAAESAASLTRQLLAFSRKQVLQKKQVDIGELVEGMHRLLERLIGEDIEFLVDLSHGELDVEADRGQMEQVVMNLCVNARDAMPNGGKLCIQTFSEFARDGKASLRLEVSDSGTGMSQELIEQAFDPFFTTKGMDGTGLGLSVVLGIVEQHNGRVDIDSEIGQGTRFIIRLPALIRQKVTVEEADEVEETNSQVGRGERILLVEDEPGVAQFVKRALSKNGYEVEVAMTVASGLKAFHKDPHSFHLVLTDAMLPDGNGIDIVNAVRELRPRMPMLLSSGYTDDRSYLDEAQNQGVAFLQKPYPLEELYLVVRGALDASNETLLGSRVIEGAGVELSS